MIYIDQEDIARFSGVSGGDIDWAIAERASDIVDQVTLYRITDFDLLSPFIRQQIKKAACAQYEYIVNAGGLEAYNGGGAQSVTLGKLSITGPVGGEVSAGVSPLVYSYLMPTGLLYRGCGR